MKIRDFRYLDNLNRFPKDYSELDKNINDKPSPFKKRFLCFIIGLGVSIFILIFVYRMFLSIV